MARTIALIFVAVLVVGCGVLSTAPLSEEEAESTVSNLPPRNPNIVIDEPITLEVWLDLDFTRDNTLFEEMATDFEKVYPEVEIEIFSFVRESMPQRVELEVQSGIPPDVVQGHVYAMAGQGLAEPLDQYWTEWEVADPQISEQFLSTALDEVTWQGVRYGVPIDIYTLVLLFNREHFDQADLAYPGGDYDLFYLKDAAATLSDPQSNRFGLGLSTDPWYVYAWVTGAGGDVLAGDPDIGYTLTLNSKTNIDALSFLTSLVDDGYAPRPTSRPRDYEDAREQFLEGQISMYFGEPQDIHLIQSTNPDFPLGVAQLPRTPAQDSAASVLGSSGLFIPRGARHKDVAFEFMRWASSDRYVLPMGRRLGRFPAKNWLQTSTEFTENLALIPFFIQLEAAQPYRLGLFPEAEEAFSDAIKASFYDIADPTAALNEAQSIGQNSMIETLP
jgi:ABC-type glycerol-3-phosphate transport system substrate-binding protein